MTFGILGRGDLHGGDQVFLAVGAWHPDWKLASGEHDGLGQILQHEAQGRRRVRHRVGSVQDHESVIFIIALLDQRRERLPEGRLYIRGVDQRVERVRVDAQGELLQFRHLIENLVEVERLEGHVLRILLHADRASRVNHQDGGSSHIPKSVLALLVVVSATSSTETPFSPAIFAAISGM